MHVCIYVIINITNNIVSSSSTTTTIVINIIIEDLGLHRGDALSPLLLLGSSKI